MKFQIKINNNNINNNNNKINNNNNNYKRKYISKHKSSRNM